jgi:DeoR/GlpR family transcriptional regulator of sugar metabolism
MAVRRMRRLPSPADRSELSYDHHRVRDVQSIPAMTTPRTTSIQLRQSIVGPFEKPKNVRADRRANRFEVNETTIPRNQVALEETGLRRRDFNVETSSFQSRLVRARREDAIAHLALNYIAEGFTILLDAGSTTLSLARALRGSFQSLFIITNSIPAALELSKTNYKILLTGGEVGDRNLALSGSAATKTLKRYHADRAFLGTSGISVAHGYSTADPLEAQVKQAMIRSADETYVLADSSKFGHAYLESFASLSAISLTLTDSGMPGKFRDAFAERGIGFKCP